MSNTLIVREEQTLIEQNLEGSIVYQTLYLNKDFDITDEFLSEVVNDIINSRQYTNIFIPLCFGPILSDFNGLRLATHIRCTPGINQNKNIYIFSFVDVNLLLDNECFDILKTKGVKLIKYNFDKIQALVYNKDIELELIDLPNEIKKKLNFKVPANYEDNHGIANEWAIYRWAQLIGANDKGIEKIIDIQNSNLYFKYLKTIYPICHLDRLESEKLKINFEGQANILYIDDEAEKGWKEIFETIFLDKNKNIDFSYLDNELNEKAKDEICELALQTIKDEDIDLVILDFRLHKDDFENISIKEVTGYQILKKIKEYNKGIQVIIFSATNKIWNLQLLQNTGADGFIVKESPENSVNAQFTKQSIENFIYAINKCLNSIFLKDFYTKLEILKGELIPRKKYEKTSEPLPKEFVDETLKWLEISNNLLSKDSTQTGLTASFLFYFSIIENMANRVIDVENPILIGVENGQNKYNFQFRLKKQFLSNFIEEPFKSGIYRKTNGKLKSSRNMPWIFKILNTIDFISDEKITEKELNSIIKKRNDIIHANATTGNIIDIDKKMIISLYNYIFIGLKSIK